jgi:glycosyltransferase involved in cell wall biosynthesis
MKLLFVWQNLDYGGGEVALVNLVEKLIDGNQIDILCYENINKFNLPKNINIISVSSPTTSKIRKYYNKIYFLYKWVLLSKKYDVMINNAIPFLTLFAYIVSLISRKKYVLWVHTCHNEMPSNLSKILSYYHKLAIKSASKIVCVSNTAAKSLNQYVTTNLQQSTVIYNIFKVNNNRYTKILHSIIEQNSDKKIINICAIGRLTHEKNFTLLINAIAKVVEIYPLIKLYICGEGVDFEILNSLIQEKKLTKHITLTGHTNVSPYLQHCDIFISSSNSESLSTAVCEALYFNRPVIATNTGAAEVLEYGKYGIVVACGDLLQLRNAIIKLIEDEQLRLNYMKNAHLALDKFNESETINQWNIIIRN